MSRSPYLLKKRGKYWYFRLAGEITFHSVNTIAKQIGYTQKVTAKSRAESIIIGYMREQDGGRVNTHDITLEQYIKRKHFFIQKECQWVRRQFKIGKKVTPDWIKQKRGHLVNHILLRFAKYRLLDIDGIEVENWLLQLDLST